MGKQYLCMGERCVCYSKAASIIVRTHGGAREVKVGGQCNYNAFAPERVNKGDKCPFPEAHQPKPSRLESMPTS